MGSFSASHVKAHPPLMQAMLRNVKDPVSIVAHLLGRCMHLHLEHYHRVANPHHTLCFHPPNALRAASRQPLSCCFCVVMRCSGKWPSFNQKNQKSILNSQTHAEDLGCRCRWPP